MAWNIYCTRISIGILAGFSTALVKYVSHDQGHILELIEMDQISKVKTLAMGYVCGAGAFMVLGAIAGAMSMETDIRRIFFVGLSAPALLGTGLAANNPTPLPAIVPAKGGWILEQVISTAYAQQQQSAAPDCIGDGPFAKGFKLFFGWRDKIAAYRVVVASYKDPAKAAARAAQVNAEDASLKAQVGPRRCDNDYYPVYVGDPVSTLEAAKKLAAQAENLKSVEDAYISPIPLQ
jgi:hypothetical protein